jgi:hypothetical protein
MILPWFKTKQNKIKCQQFQIFSQTVTFQLDNRMIQAPTPPWEESIISHQGLQRYMLLKSTQCDRQQYYLIIFINVRLKYLTF